MKFFWKIVIRFPKPRIFRNWSLIHQLCENRYHHSNNNWRLRYFIDYVIYFIHSRTFLLYCFVCYMNFPSKLIFATDYIGAYEYFLKKEPNWVTARSDNHQGALWWLHLECYLNSHWPILPHSVSLGLISISPFI